MGADNLLEQIAGKTVTALGDNIPDEVRGKTPNQLRELVEIADAHLRSLHQDEDTGELRDLTPDEDAAFAYLLKVRESAVARIEEHRAVTDVLARRPKAVQTAYGTIRRGLDDQGNVVRMSVPEARDAAMRMLDDKRNVMAGELRSDEKDQVAKLINRNTDVARRILVTETEAYRSAWMKLMTKPDGSMYLDDEERAAMRAFDEYRAASSTNAAGGYGIPVFIDPSIILTAQNTRNPFLQIAKQVDVNTNIWKGVSSAGMSWAFVQELSEVGDNAPTIAQPTVNIYTARGFIPFSIEIGEDYPGFASEMSTLLSSGYAELLVDKFTRGSGTNEPFGVLTVLSASTGNRVAIQTSGTAFGPNDPYTLWKSLPQRFRTNASWLMSVDTNNHLRQIGTANVFHAYTINLPAEWADMFFGKQAYESPYMPDTTTSTSANTGMVVVGDFSNFVIARRTGMSVEYIPHLFHTNNNLPMGERGWFAYSRIGSNVVNTFAFKLLVNT